MLDGAVAAYHDATRNMVSTKFGTERLSEKVLPHITLYRQFSRETPFDIQRVLRVWTSTAIIPGYFSMQDYSHFDNKVVCATIEADEMVMKSVAALREEIKTIPGIPPEDFPIWIPHASVATDLTEEQSVKILEFLNLKTMQKPDFKFPFDAVTLMVKIDQKWEVVEKFPLNKK